MARTAGRKRDRGSARWIVNLLGMFLLIATGFGSGLVIGLIAEEPELLLGHLSGRSEEVAWLPDAEADFSKPVRPLASAQPSAVAAREAGSEAPPAVSAGGAPGEGRSRPAASRADRPRAGWAVQVGAFGKSRVAETMARELSGDGFAAYVTPSAGQADGRWRVRVGPVETREEAEGLARRLEHEQDLPTWILSEGG